MDELYQAAAPYYDLSSTGLPGDAPSHVEEARQAGSPVLELACGTGRILPHYVFRYEVQYLLELCGFRVEALHGDLHRSSFHPGGEQVWVAQRR